MATVSNALLRVAALIDVNIHNDITKQEEFVKQTILDDESLTIDEKNKVINIWTNAFDGTKISRTKGTKRICENCSLECFATFYCEHCVRNYLKNNFSNWTSGNDDIDILIQDCQMISVSPNDVIEWIPYNNLQNIKYMTKGGISEIYSGIWNDGQYNKWNSKEKRLERIGRSQKVVLKRLENVESASRNWFEEAVSHLVLSSQSASLVRCYGLTQDPSSGNYMLIMDLMDTDLRKYLQHQRTWKEKIFVAFRTITALKNIHEYKAVHRDLHSGNILCLQFNDGTHNWCISDFGFCGPADKPLKSIYGNLAYIAPEVIVGKEYTFASDIYSFGILMWEISSGQTPFNNYEHDYDLAMKIVNGMRPKIRSEIPLKYKKLMIQCWDADPLKRPDARTILSEIFKLWQDYYKDNYTSETNTLDYNSSSQISQTDSSSSSSTSKLHQFENLPEPRNATEEEQEAFHSKPYDFEIPDNIEDNLPKGQDELDKDIIEILDGLGLD